MPISIGLRAGSLAVAASVLLSGFLAGCRAADEQAASERSATSSTEIKIAAIGPMTGNYTVFGAQFRRGTKQAIDDINAAGGVLGKRISLVVEDDRCDPADAVEAARRVAARGVVLVVGHFCSGSSIPASKIYQWRDVLMISPASTHPVLTDQGYDLVFRVVPRDDVQPAIAAAYIAREMAGRSVGIAHDGTSYGTYLAKAMRRALSEQGIETGLDERIRAGRSSYSDLADKVAAKNIEVLYYGGYHTEAAPIVRDLRDRGLDTQLITGDALLANEYWMLAGDAAEGTLMTFVADPQRHPAAQAVVQRFEAKGEIPGHYTLFSYAAVQAWAQAAERAGTTEPAKVATALRSMETSTVLGRRRFDEHGDITDSAIIIYRWSGGQYAPYWSPD